MVIHDGSLVKRIKEQYRGGGYTVISEPGGWTVIMCAAWAVRMKNDHLPREVLGLLALHLGFLPEEETAYRIMKGKDGPSVQDMIFESAMDPVNWLRGLAAAAEQTAAVPVKKTLLTLDGWNLWQKCGNGGMVMVDPDYEDLFRNKEGITMAGEALYRKGILSECYVMRGTGEKHDRELTHLGKIFWIGT